MSRPGHEERLRGVRERRALVGPEQVVIDLTNRCNNNCLGCWTRSPLLREDDPGDEWKRQELPLSLLERLLEDLGELQTSQVRFTGGGEPFMHPSIRELLRLARSRVPHLSVTTNFTLVSPRAIEEICALPVDELAISLWAATPDTYARLHPNKTGRTFERMMDRLRQLIAARRDGRPRVTIANVLCSVNHHEFAAMIDLARHAHADAVYFALLDPMPDQTDGLLLQPGQQQQLLAIIDELDRAGVLRDPAGPEIENLDGFLERLRRNDPVRGRYDMHHIDAIPCYVGWLFCRIMADGGVSPCCRGVRLPMGNLHEQAFREIWFSQRYETFRNNALTLPKSDAYFEPIGCGKTCDNLMHNREFHGHLEASRGGK